jgi:8-hydroxy-5-deazaflavin:NADPH oxidoreductase
MLYVWDVERIRAGIGAAVFSYVARASAKSRKGRSSLELTTGAGGRREMPVKYGVLGTGQVGQELATKLAALGNEVCMGSRSQESKEAKAWLERVGKKGRTGTFAEAARFGEVVVNCTQGAHSMEALSLVDKKDLRGKVLIDVANPLDASRGMPPILSICNSDSLGESIQREFPEVKVVKTLNTVNFRVMTDPTRVPGEHDLFICGNDDAAKKTVTALLRAFGWKSIIDLGDITNARATEQLMPIWIRLWGRLGTADFNFRIVKAA